MSTGFGSSQDIKEGPVVKYYTGVENFKVVAINPSKAELEAIYGREINFEPEYLGTTEVEDGDGKREVPQYRIDLYLANEDNSITTKAQFYIADTHHASQTGKYKVINSFGRTTWLTKEDIQSRTLPSNMQWYNPTGLKIAKRGEEHLIDFLVNLLNLPFKIDELEDESDAYASIDNNAWAKIFQGDVSLIKGILDNTNNKIGLLLGVKTKADGKLVQTVFNRKSLRQYTKSSTRANKYQYLTKDLEESKAAGAFGNVEFGADDYEIREFEVGSTKISSENSNQTDVFAQASGAQDEFPDNNKWMED
jgi:hypothetical protein